MSCPKKPPVEVIQERAHLGVAHGGSRGCGSQYNYCWFHRVSEVPPHTHTLLPEDPPVVNLEWLATYG